MDLDGRRAEDQVRPDSGEEAFDGAAQLLRTPRRGRGPAARRSRALASPSSAAAATDSSRRRRPYSASEPAATPSCRVPSVAIQVCTASAAGARRETVPPAPATSSSGCAASTRMRRAREVARLVGNQRVFAQPRLTRLFERFRASLSGRTAGPSIRRHRRARAPDGDPRRRPRSASRPGRARSSRSPLPRRSPGSRAITSRPGPPGVSQKTRRRAPSRRASAAATAKSGGRSEPSGSLPRKSATSASSPETDRTAQPRWRPASFRQTIR